MNFTLSSLVVLCKNMSILIYLRVETWVFMWKQIFCWEKRVGLHTGSRYDLYLLDIQNVWHVMCSILKHEVSMQIDHYSLRIVFVSIHLNCIWLFSVHIAYFTCAIYSCSFVTYISQRCLIARRLWRYKMGNQKR